MLCGQFLFARKLNEPGSDRESLARVAALESAIGQAKCILNLISEEQGSSFACATHLRVGDTQPIFFHTSENRQPVKERQTFALIPLLEC